jgi:hypothetical protein
MGDEAKLVYLGESVVKVDRDRHARCVWYVGDDMIAIDRHGPEVEAPARVGLY